MITQRNNFGICIYKVYYEKLPFNPPLYGPYNSNSGTIGLSLVIETRTVVYRILILEVVRVCTSVYHGQEIPEPGSFYTLDTYLPRPDVRPLYHQGREYLEYNIPLFFSLFIYNFTGQNYSPYFLSFRSIPSYPSLLFTYYHHVIYLISVFRRDFSTIYSSPGLHSLVWFLTSPLTSKNLLSY